MWHLIQSQDSLCWANAFSLFLENLLGGSGITPFICLSFVSLSFLYLFVLFSWCFFSPSLPSKHFIFRKIMAAVFSNPKNSYGMTLFLSCNTCSCFMDTTFFFLSEAVLVSNHVSFSPCLRSGCLGFSPISPSG